MAQPKTVKSRCFDLPLGTHTIRKTWTPCTGCPPEDPKLTITAGRFDRDQVGQCMLEITTGYRGKNLTRHRYIDRGCNGSFVEHYTRPLKYKRTTCDTGWTKRRSHMHAGKDKLLDAIRTLVPNFRFFGGCQKPAK